MLSMSIFIHMSNSEVTAGCSQTETIQSVHASDGASNLPWGPDTLLPEYTCVLDLLDWPMTTSCGATENKTRTSKAAVRPL